MPYTISLTLQDPPEPGFEVEPNDVLEYATDLGDPFVVRGGLNGRNTDFYRFAVTGEAQLWRIQVVGEQGFDPTGLIPIQHDPPSRHQGICSGQNGISAPCCDHLLRPPPRQGWTSQPLKANLMEGLQH